MWPHDSFPKRPRRWLRRIPVDVWMMVLIIGLLVIGGALVLSYP